ncbi:MAG: hypothetical protein D6807_00175 [Alphaproteobacteria bacterium]|nr:MAG: hypothetical protein D6807_00175 [Alphaproteobacteria bacterium]
MKLRLQAKSLIVRLDGAEARRLLEDGEIAERFFLPGTSLGFQLRLIEGDAPFRLDFSADTLQLSGVVGRARFAAEHARPSKNGLKSENETGSAALQIDLKSVKA